MRTNVRAYPGKKEFSYSFENGILHVWLEARAEKNEANRELLKQMKKLFGCDVALVRGATSRSKVLELGCTESAFREKIAQRAKSD